MIIGVDFDNTIVCYDQLFYDLARERGLIPEDLPQRKADVRKYLLERDQEALWTELQGLAYGPRIGEAPPYPGVVEFFTHALRSKVPIYIVSHKTRYPVIGARYDLHEAARDWLVAQGFFDGKRASLSPEQVRFGLTRQEKVQLIHELGCTHFVDDLEETFLEETFPKAVDKILFAPEPTPISMHGAKVLRNWAQIHDYVFTSAS